MTREQLKGAYSEGEALALYNEVKRTGGDFVAFAQAYIHDEDYQVARNALWAMTKATNDELKPLQPMMDVFIDLGMHADNSSVRRIALNIVDRLQMNEEDLRTDFLDYCMERMVDPDEYPGIQSLCMKQAFRMCSFYPELMGELKRTLLLMEMSYYSPAVKSVRERILNGKLKKW